jgi:hypothetical protein
MVMTLVEFLTARWDEAEATAREADFEPWEVGPTFGALDNRVYVRREGDPFDSIGTCVIACQVPNMPRFRANARHIAANDPAHVLADITAKRAILAEHAIKDNGAGKPDSRYCWTCYADRGYNADSSRYLAWCRTVRLLAVPFADHPDYDESWRP